MKIIVLITVITGLLILGIFFFAAFKLNKENEKEFWRKK